jgi:predicted TIM-barrel fold metal-dependent hydrolase
MATRRHFIGQTASAMAGMALAGAGVRDAAAAAGQPAGAAARRQVVVGGRRITTVDVHAHCEIPGVREMMGGATSANRALTIGPDRLQAMDAMGIDVEVLSINPFWYAVDRDIAPGLIRAQNEGLAAICAANPDRFAALATVSLQHPDLAAGQLEEGVTALGLRGGSVGASVGSEELAARRFDPFWAKAEELDVPIFLHPQGVPELESRLQGNGFLGNVIGNPLGTTLALSHLIFEGTLDRFPGLKICAAHGGGYLPSYADRSDYGCATRPAQCTGPLARRPTDYVKQLYVDALVFSSEALRHLVSVVGASRVVIGTDYPFPWTATPDDARVPRFEAVNHVLDTPGLSDADRAAILGGNAATLFNLPA